MKFKNIYSFIIGLSLFSIVGIVQASTTISTDINTGGNLTVSGSSTLTDLFVNNIATSTFSGPLTLATSTNNLAIPSTDIVAWGDSLTGGGVGNTIYSSYPAQLQNLTGYAVYNMGVSGEVSTFVVNRFLTDPTLWSNTTIIWIGRNNFTQQSQILADLNTIVSHLRTNNYAILSIVNSSTTLEWSGGSDYNSIIAVNNAIAAAYPGHYFDIRGALVAGYNPGLPNDVFNHSKDVPPDSLRGDYLHYNAAGNLFIANYIKNNILPSIGVTVSGNVVTYSMLLNELKSPVGIGSQNPSTGYFRNLYLHPSTTPTGIAVPLGKPENAYSEVPLMISGITNQDTILGGTSDFANTNTYMSPLIELLDSSSTATMDIFAPYHTMRSTYIGLHSGRSTRISAVNNVTVGNDTLLYNTTGSYNSAFGVSSQQNGTGSYNSSFGDESMITVTGSKNSCLGYFCQYYITSGSSNVSVGSNAGFSLTSGSNNTFVGTFSGWDQDYWPTVAVTTGSNNTFIGFNAAPGTTTQLNNSGSIGNEAKVGCSNCFVIGGTGANAVNVGIGTTTPISNFEVTASSTNATTTMTIGKSGQNKGSCIKLFRSDGSAIYASVAAGATTFTLSTTACASVSGF